MICSGAHLSIGACRSATAQSDACALAAVHPRPMSMCSRVLDMGAIKNQRGWWSTPWVATPDVA
eukprot:15479894-Alexandrium_andersonii.AAC.1